MNKYSGNVADFKPVAEDNSRVVISYGLQVKENDLAEWNSVIFYKAQGKPNLGQAKAAIIADIDERVKNKIIGGFVYNEKPVWLSIENQLNFSLAVAPVTMKIGEQEYGTPVYETFETKAALKAFNDACLAWKNQCLADGWTEKDGMDWTPYEVLNPSASE